MGDMTTIREDGPDRKRGRCAAVHQLLPPDGLYPRAGRGLRGRAGPGGQGRDRADPDQQPDVRRRASPDLPGHRHRQRLHRSGARIAGSNRDERCRTWSMKACAAPTINPENKLRASILADPAFTRRNTRDNTPCVLSVEMVPGQQGLGRCRGQGRRQREQVQVQDDEPERFDRRLGARDAAADGRGLVPAGDARASASAARPNIA